MSEPARIDTENTFLQRIAASTGPPENQYVRVIDALRSSDYYDPIFLGDFEPEDRRIRFKWIQSLSIPFDGKLLRRSYGGNIGTMVFLWKVPDEPDETKELQLILDITKRLPDFHSRQMEKDFINQYRKLAKTPVSVLRSMYREISGDAREMNESEREAAARICAFMGCFRVLFYQK